MSYIAGPLSVTSDDAAWTLTVYIAANAIILPVTGFFSQKFGRKKFFLTMVIGFTVTSFLCGIAPNLDLLLLFRALQGFSGGTLKPVSQAILMESFPEKKRGMAMSIFSIGVVFALILGPVIGGWLTDQYSWRWVFYINLPVGILATILTREVTKAGKKIELQKKEYSLLEYLMRNAGRIVTKTMILESIWGIILIHRRMLLMCLSTD